MVGLLDLIAHCTLLAAMLLGVLGFLFLGVGPRTGTYRTVTMLTGSMRPTYPVGSVLVDRPQPTSSLQVGQVLTYAIPTDDHRVVSHRVISVKQDGEGAYLIRTKGDANNGPDPWVARVTDQRVWTARGVIPHAGSLILTLRGPHAKTLALYVIPAICALWTLVGVWRRS
ncbi:MAG: signal peptidase [Frankiaceae bacterium]|nr:signal peptidase [Frankiaceae bacterium]MDX6274204.1 signal peptidase [Frankiales bacterium]